MDGVEKVADALIIPDLRRSIARLAGLSWSRPARLYRLVPPDSLAMWDTDGAEMLPEVVQGTVGRPASMGAPFSSSDEVIPLELDPATLWGYWVVAKEDALSAKKHLPELLGLIQRLDALEVTGRLEETNADLQKVLDLGGELSRCKGPGEVVAALHRATRQVFAAETTHLVIMGLRGSRWYNVSRGVVDSGETAARDWLEAFPDTQSRWQDGAAPATVVRFLGDDHWAGMATRIGVPAYPQGILVVARKAEPFTERSQEILARMADFVFASLLKWERASGGGAKAFQNPDLLVVLAQEKERLEYIMRSIPVGMLLTDAQGVIALANDTAGHALGLTDVELREKKIFSSRQAGRTLRGLIEKTQAEGKAVSTPYEMEGRWFQIEVIPWPGGAQFLVVTQDVHDWHQLNRLKEDLISIISHEVKNPLTAVINAAHLLASGRAGPMNDAQGRVAALIQENSQQIKSLLDDVVRLSRVYHVNVKHEPVGLTAMVQAVHDRSSSTVKGKLISWTESLEDLTVGADVSMLDNLLQNLIGNAIKYTGIGGHVGVRLWGDADLARLRVMDDGPGIPAEEQQRLFQPFFRASNVRDQVAGTGLGLVIARNIAERLGGTLQAQSPMTPEDAAFLGLQRSATRGTAFQVDLPRFAR